MFTLGGSSDEDAASSFEAYSLKQRSSLTENLRKAPALAKTTSFKKEVVTRTYHDITSESDGAIESDSEDDVDESAIEDDEDSEDGEWEDEDNEEDDSVPSSLKEVNPFQRVESSANLTSRRSLLTTQLHEGDRAQALQNAASRSSPAIRRSRTTTPNGPSTGNSPQEEGLMMRQLSKPKPIIQTTSNQFPPAMSPRSTRRNMMQQELTGSLRQNLLWERQQKNATSNAVAKRQQSAVSLPALRRAATTSNITGMTSQAQQNVNPSTSFKDTSSVDAQSNYFDSGLNIYHVSGW
jgi:hypothetical protein